MNLPNDSTRCAGGGCPERDGCLRFRQLGYDEMAPKPVEPRRYPVADTLRSAQGRVCVCRIVPMGETGTA